MEIQQVRRALHSAIDPYVVGTSQHAAIDGMLLALLCGGHVLVEGVPGIAKTRVTKLFAQCLHLSHHNVDGTPDRLPSELTGSSPWNPATHAFEFLPGSLNANVVLLNEINRMPPRTQSALLRVMEEGKITTDHGLTYDLPQPYLVLATQNPIEQEGTYPLPEAELDRFLMRLIMGYPQEAEEIRLLELSLGAGWDSAPALTALVPRDAIGVMRAQVRTVAVDRDLLVTLAQITQATRTHAQVRLGISPRASLHWLHVAQAHAALDGHDYIKPDDLRTTAEAVLAHRLIFHPEASYRTPQPMAILDPLLARLAQGTPVSAQSAALRRKA